MIAGLVLATTLTIILAVRNRQNYYEATASIMPSAVALSKPMVPGTQVTGTAGEGNHDGNQIANLMSLITSRAVAERVIDALGLQASPDKLRWQIGVSLAPNPAGQGRQSRNTDIIQIAVVDSDPDNAVNIANATAMVFTRFYQEITHQAAMENAAFLEEDLATARIALDQSAAELKEFRERHNITSLGEESASAIGARRNMQTQREQAAAELAQVTSTLARINQQLKSIPPNRTEIRGTTDSPRVQEFERRASNLAGQLADAESRYTDAHPTVQRLRDEIAEATAQLEEERTRVRTTTTVVPNPVYQDLQAQKVRLTNDREGLAARVAQLGSAIGRVGSAPPPGVEIQMSRLMLEYENAQARYTDLKNRLAAARLDEKDTTDTGAIRLVDRAYTAEGPIGRSRISYVFMGIIFSLIFGVGLAIAMEYLDNKIRSEQDLEELLALPVTTLIPTVAGRAAPALPRITYIDPLSPLAEAYRFLRTDLLLTAAESGVKTMMIATAKPGQGGTTTAANLAISLAMDGKRVVLVDADLRRPMLHTIFKATNQMGLSNVLTGENDLDEVMISTEITGLTLIPGGPTPLNPAELLGSRKMQEIVQQLKTDVDFVIFDTPAAIAFTDTVVLSQWLDGAILVVRANQIPRGAELQVRDLFNKAKVRILSVVLNDVQPTSVDSYYYHSHYYPTGAPTRPMREEKQLPAPEIEKDEDIPAASI